MTVLQNQSQIRRKKRNKSRIKKIIINFFLGATPLMIIMGLLILFMSSIGVYFSSAHFSDKLTETENSELITQAQNRVNDLSKDMKDYYNTDRRFKLDYQYILAFTKYICSNESFARNTEHNSVGDFKEQINNAANDLWPKLEYKQDKIITVREYKVKVKKLDEERLNGNIKVFNKMPEKTLEELGYEKMYIYDEDTTYYKDEDEQYKYYSGRPNELTGIDIYTTEPKEFDANSYSTGQRIYIVDKEKLYTCNEYEEIRVDRKEEIAYFLTHARTIKETYDITYEDQTNTIQKDDEKITTTKPVISSMKQVDKNWDVLKQIISSKYKNDDINKALEVILASAASYVNENVTEDMIYTGGGSGGVISPENFSGSEREFIEKVSVGAIESYKKYKIFPSITIAQAILESGWGKSGLTIKANNLFGIKAYGWSGAIVEMLTAEYNSDGSKYYISAAFRAYNSWDHSIEDHSNVLLNDRYAGVRNATDYREAAEQLRVGGYATDPGYPSLIISIIEKYGLYQYDK